MLAVLVSMLSPSVGWATTFIKDVAVSIDKDEKTAKNALSNNGYTVDNTDLNALCGNGSFYVYVGYKTTTNAAEAITDLIVTYKYHPSSFTWSKTGKTYQQASNVLGNGDLNRGEDGPSLWLYYSKTDNTTNGTTLVTSVYGHNNGKDHGTSSPEFLVGVHSATDNNPNGSQDLNEGCGKGTAYVYLGQKKEHTHRFSYWDYDTDKHRYGCASCGYVKSTTAHNWSNSGAKIQDQTCTTAEVHYQTCTTCGRKNDANHTYIAGNALGHSFDEVNDPHHTNCTRCKHTFFRYQSKDGNVVKPYRNNFGEAQILSNTYTNGEGVIEFDRTLTTIGENAFYNCTGLTGNLVIPNSVTSIGNNALRECKGLTGDLVIPNSVTSIGNSAFYWCSGFNGNLSIGNSVTSIGNSAFYYCSGFNGNLEIPNSVTSIGNYAFDGCKGFTGDLVIPNSVTSIGEDAFYNCSGFNGKLVIPNSVISIGNYAFRECKGLTGDLVIPNSVTSIGNYAFAYCSGFNGNLSIGNSVISIGNYAFRDCNGLTGDLVIPNSVTSIGNYAFYYCSGLTGDLEIPNSVTSIGECAFAYCKGLTGKLEIPNSVTSIGNKAFNNCTNLKNVLFLGNKPETMGNAIFGYDNLTLYVKDLSQWNTNEKYSANRLTYKTWKEYCEEVIGEHDLDENCTCSFCGSKIHTFADEDTHHDFCTQCKHGFFRYQSKDGNVVEPYRNNFGDAQIVSNTYAEGEGVIEFDRKLTTIGYRAFYKCYGLTGDLVIPNSVTSIGNYAFYRCSGLKNVLFLGDKPETMGESVFLEDNLTLYVKDLSQWDTNEMYSAESLTYKTLKEYCEEVIGEHDLDENCACSICGSKIHTFADEDKHHTNCTQCKHTFFRYQSKDGNVVDPYLYNFGEAKIVSNTYAEGEGVIEFDRKLTTIGYSAFTYCSGLTGDLVIPNSVTSIGDGAFYECKGLTGNLVIPNSVTSIRQYAFYGCSGLKNVLFLGDKPETMGEGVFYEDTLTLYVKDLSQWDTNEMYDAKSLTYKTLKEYCEEVIGHHDPDENCTCSFCGSIHTFADEDTHHDFCTQCKHTFFRYHSLNGKEVYPDNSDFGEAQIVSNTYAEGEGVIEFDRKLTTIGDLAFYDRSGLTGNLVIPNTVTSIGNYAFRKCTGLTGDLVIPNTVTSIGNDAFYECYGFNGTLSIGNSVTSIGDNAFAECYGFTGNLVIPNSVTSIGNYAFYNCYGFTGDLVIPNSVTSIGNEAFAECYSLQSVEIASLPLFGEDAFYGVPCSISVALTDESYVCGEKEFDDSELPSLQSASYTRQMTNEWGTLVLPFGIDYLPENGNYRLYRLERVENQTLLLGEYAEGNIPAGTPVVVKAVGEKDSKGKYTLSIKQDELTFDVNTKTVECDNNVWCMKGTLEPMTAAAGAPFDPEGMNVYYIAQNQFWYANQAFDMARFRAWFEAPEGAEEASAMRFQIMEIEESGIRSCAAGEKAESSFDLQGRRMSAPVKGLQIINGRKVLKK